LILADYGEIGEFYEIARLIVSLAGEYMIDFYFWYDSTCEKDLLLINLTIILLGV
jgi:hypothetical protein